MRSPDDSVPPPFVVRGALPPDAPALALLAARTFPLACPPGASPEAIAVHIAENLSVERFATWIAEPRSRVLVAQDAAGDLRGYALVVNAGPEDPHVARAVGPRARLELSKIYVDREAQGTRIAAALMRGTITAARSLDPDSPLYLGTNELNQRARSFYRKHGFVVVGTRTYVVGGESHHDVVMLRPTDTARRDEPRSTREPAPREA